MQGATACGGEGTASQSSRLSEQTRDDCHANVQSMFHLSEIRRARVLVKIVRELVDARQRVQDAHAVLGAQSRQQIGRDEERVLHRLVFGDGREALFLHTSH